jgi:hypothetical protein
MFDTNSTFHMSAPDAFVPEKVNPVVFIVMLSVFEVPVSSALSKSGVPGTVGAVVSIVKDSPVDVAEFPAVSYDTAVTVCDPAVMLASASP